jgi:hypothetical protein
VNAKKASRRQVLLGAIAVIHLSRGAPVAPVDELGQR